MYIYSWTIFDKILTHFGDALCKKYIYIYNIFIACGVQLDNGVHPQGIIIALASCNFCVATSIMKLKSTCRMFCNCQGKYVLNG